MQGIYLFSIFVKTIGLSPLKTRLAKDLGTEQAQQFYRLSCEAIAEVIQRRAAKLKGYWAVAEGAQAWERWPTLECLDQGTGGLGERLHKIYAELLKSYQFVVLLGADAPQLSPGLLDVAMEQGADGSFVIGPATDGGFYLLLGSKPIPKECWLNVRYSTNQTRSELVKHLKKIAPVKEMGKLTDVDQMSDLEILAKELCVQDSLVPGQDRLAKWLKIILNSTAHEI